MNMRAAHLIHEAVLLEEFEDEIQELLDASDVTSEQVQAFLNERGHEILASSDSELLAVDSRWMIDLNRNRACWLTGSGSTGGKATFPVTCRRRP